jgi:hypothetical protein
MSGDLVERVARLYEDKWGISDQWLARAAIAVVLDEAADAVGEVGDHAEAGAYIAAIRAMIPKEGV